MSAFLAGLQLLCYRADKAKRAVIRPCVSLYRSLIVRLSGIHQKTNFLNYAYLCRIINE